MSYITLEAFLKKKEQGLFWELLKKLSQEDQIAELKKFMLDTASLHNDEAAAFLWEALLRAVSDQMLALLMKRVVEFRSSEIQIRSACPIDPEATRIHKEHREFCAALAQEIFGKIPAFQEMKEWDADQGKNLLVKRLTLLETKKLLWKEIASWWHDTADDQTAMQMLDWLLTMEVITEERDALRGIIRDHVGCMNEMRLLAGMMRVKQYRESHHGIEEGEQKKYLRCNDTDEWLKLMLHAWIKQQQPMKVVNQLAALAPVAAHGPMAWDLLRQLAEPMGEFCLQARLLQEFIKPETAYRSIFEAETIVRYEKLGEAIVEISANNEPYVHDQNGADVKLAATIGEKLGGWMNHHPGIKIFARIGYRSTIPGQGFHQRMEFWVS